MPPTPFAVNIALFAVGLYVIIKGSDLFLDNAIWMARASGISQIVIGATIVSVCTTLPEMVSSCTASLKGASDMALGNAIGSVICNTGFILAIVLLFVDASVRRHLFAFRGVFLLGVLVLAWLLAMPSPLLQSLTDLPPDARFGLSRANGLVLLVALLVYLALNYLECRHEPAGAPTPTVDPETEAVDAPTRVAWLRRTSLFGVGGVLVGVGAFLLVEFGQRLARDFGVSDAVISLVLVAFGTSLPELFTAISAVRKNAQQISVGNILGANVLNLALVTGAAATLRPLAFQDRLLVLVDMPVAIALCAFVFADGMVFGRLGRKTGIVLLLFYGFYLFSMIALRRIG
jgi:cation:H+ antiporter